MCQLGFLRGTASSTIRTFRVTVTQQKYRRSLPLPIPEIKSFSRLSADFNMFFQSRLTAERSRQDTLIRIPFSGVPGVHQKSIQGPDWTPPTLIFRRNKAKMAVRLLVISTHSRLSRYSLHLAQYCPFFRLRVDAAHSRVVGDAINCQHISCRASVHRMGVGIAA